MAELKNFPPPIAGDPQADIRYREMYNRQQTTGDVGAGNSLWMKRYEGSRDRRPGQPEEIGLPHDQYMEAVRQGRVDLGSLDEVTARVGSAEKQARLQTGIGRGPGWRQQYFQNLILEKEQFPDEWTEADEGMLESLGERFDDEYSDRQVVGDALSPTSGNKTMLQSLGNLIGIGRK